MYTQNPFVAHRNRRARLAVVVLLVLAGCHSARLSRRSPKGHRASGEPPIRGVVCLFDQKPWISTDAAGDRDPEGIRYRVFLDVGAARGVFRDGKFHIEMYRIEKGDGGEMQRTLVSDWHYPVDAFPQISARVLGQGYIIQLRWAKKDLAGSEVEFITQFEDTDGNISRGATKRLRVPKYAS